MWNREGEKIRGLYLDLVPFAGVVTKSRVKYGGRVQHDVELDAPIVVYGEPRNSILITETL